MAGSKWRILVAVAQFIDDGVDGAGVAPSQRRSIMFVI